MAHYYNIVITRRIKIHEPLPDNCSVETLEDDISVEYPFDCEEIDGSCDVTIEDVD